MAVIKIKNGLDIPISGQPAEEVDVKEVNKVALLGQDYVGMKPTLAVSAGDRVKLGQVVFEDKKTPGVKYTAPCSGKVLSINRGEKRVFLSMIFEVDGDEKVDFASFSSADALSNLSREQARDQLIESGLWTLLRTRPFSRVPKPDSVPHSIFINAMDTQPLAPSIELMVQGEEEHFRAGIRVLSVLTKGTLYLTSAPGVQLPQAEADRVQRVDFAGPHPAGAVGTHIHFLDPVHRNKMVWTINAQDVVHIGQLFLTGHLRTEQVMAITGPGAKNPRHIRTRIGASLEELLAGEIDGGEHRLISGSVLSGRTAKDVTAFLGRFHQQVCILPRGNQRQFLGWLSPGRHLYSHKNIVLSKLLPTRDYDFSTALHGGKRAIVPSNSYERVMPLDILPTFLLRALAVDDIDESEKLGVLELDEEDLALCTFVCPSKIDHGVNLRRVLTIIEKEG